METMKDQGWRLVRVDYYTRADPFAEFGSWVLAAAPGVDVRRAMAAAAAAWARSEAPEAPEDILGVRWGDCVEQLPDDILASHGLSVWRVEPDETLRVDYDEVLFP